jgi:hypothetical protein
MNEKIVDVCVNSLNGTSNYKGISEEIFEDSGNFYQNNFIIYIHLII